MMYRAKRAGVAAVFAVFIVPLVIAGVIMILALILALILAGFHAYGLPGALMVGMGLIFILVFFLALFCEG